MKEEGGRRVSRKSVRGVEVKSEVKGSVGKVEKGKKRKEGIDKIK